MEGGQGVHDVIACLDGLIRSHLDFLDGLTGDDDEDDEGDLLDISMDVSWHRAARRLREAQSWAASANGKSGSDEMAFEDELGECLRQALLALANQYAAVGSIRMDEERSLMGYMKAALRNERERCEELSERLRLLQIEKKWSPEPGGSISEEGSGGVGEGGAQGDGGQTAAAGSAASHLLVEVDEPSPEFSHLKSLLQRSADASRSMTLAVRRIRRIDNAQLEARFLSLKGNLDSKHQSVIKTVFHGCEARLCELIAEGGFRLPKDLGNKPGRYGNAIHLSDNAVTANETCETCLGRVRSLIVSDVATGRVLRPCAGEPPADDVGALPDMNVERIKEAGFDSVFVHDSQVQQNEYAIYDPAAIIPRYIIDFELHGLGNEDSCGWSGDPKVVERLKEVERLRNEEGNARIKALRAAFKAVSSAIQECTGQIGRRLTAMQRHQDPALWDRCAQRLSQAVNDGPGLGHGLEAVMTQVERIVNPVLACEFYERASELFYPEEPFQLLLHGCPVDECQDIAEQGFYIASNGDAANGNLSRFGPGLYFSTGVSSFKASGLGSHKLFLCEVALGKPMLVQSERSNLDTDALQRAGFDSVSAPRRSSAECDDWVVYNAAQALPLFLLTYDVQPKAVAAQLLQQIVCLDVQKRSLDSELTLMRQELEDARADVDELRNQLADRTRGSEAICR
eukprot:TRINITY_DN28382_c0_g1_i2.p1 TRINITY_DN28382_c0_g1~~TRINITY_DN28382_c0_g1_i2.p1  ORF type:complete len:684 (-),score=156.08 TRINITY_DN28382_c0_g1_i2:8-2059(-)